MLDITISVWRCLGATAGATCRRWCSFWDIVLTSRDDNEMKMRKKKGLRNANPSSIVCHSEHPWQRRTASKVPAAVNCCFPSYQSNQTATRGSCSGREVHKHQLTAREALKNVHRPKDMVVLSHRLRIKEKHWGNEKQLPSLNFFPRLVPLILSIPPLVQLSRFGLGRDPCRQWTLLQFPPALSCNSTRKHWIKQVNNPVSTF